MHPARSLAITLASLLPAFGTLMSWMRQRVRETHDRRQGSPKGSSVFFHHPFVAGVAVTTSVPPHRTPNTNTLTHSRLGSWCVPCEQRMKRTNVIHYISFNKTKIAAPYLPQVRTPRVSAGRFRGADACFTSRELSRF